MQSVGKDKEDKKLRQKANYGGLSLIQNKEDKK